MGPNGFGLPQNFINSWLSPFIVTHMWDLVDSVKKFGVLEPVVVIPRQKGGYEMVSGHRRQRACQLAGITTMPVIVRQLDRDEATISMVDANMKRENITPMEKARAYQMKLEAMKRKAGRRSKSEILSGEKPMRADEQLAQQTGESRSNIQKLVRLNNLTPELQQTAVKPPGGQKFLRLDGLGDGYTEADIQARLSAVRSGETPPPHVPFTGPVQWLTPGRRYRAKKPFTGKPHKLKGFRALYFKYLYLLGAIPKRRTAVVSRTEIIKFDRYQKQFRYLMNNRIETDTQLAMQYDALQAEIDALTGQRRELYKLRRAGHGDDTVSMKITDLTERLRGLRRDLKLCAHIADDLSKVQAAVQEEQISSRSREHDKAERSKNLDRGR